MFLKRHLASYISYVFDAFVKNSTFGGIDLRIGEAKVVQHSLAKFVNLQQFSAVDWEYQPPSGLPSLVDYLESKHSCHVVVSNGAKQGLLAAFYALKLRGIKTVGLYSPHWTLLPPLIELAGLKPVLISRFDQINTDSFLLVSPNNPDNISLTKEELTALEKDLKARNIPLIHDAVYHNPIYMKEHTAPTVGDVQIFSASKAFGLSSARVGYSLVRDVSLYKDMVHFIETSTVGVSALSQHVVENVLKHLDKYPTDHYQFISNSRSALSEARNELATFPSDVISHPNMDEGIFAWCALHDPARLERAQIKVIDGVHFGSPGYCRINLGLGVAVIREAKNILISH